LAAAVDHTIFDALPEALIVVRGGELAWMNRAAREMLGESVVGRRLDAVLAPREIERLDQYLDQRRRGWDLPATCRVCFTRLADGAEVITDLRFGQAGDDLVLSARDVTDVTRAEEIMGRLAHLATSGSALPGAEALLDAAAPVFEALGWIVAFTEIVPSGSITHRVMAPPGDPVGDYGRSIVGVLMPFDKTPVLAEVVKGNRSIFLDNLPTLQHGPEQRAVALGDSMARAHVIRSAWSPVISDGKLTHVLAVTGRDLTEHDFVAVQLFAAQIGAAIQAQRLRAELVQKERLAAVGEMAAVMAHEVRNPLAVIFNALSGLRKRGCDQPSLELIDIIHEESERLRRLITDLLDFSRPSAVQVDSVDLGGVVRQAAAAAKLDPAVGGGTPEIQIDVAPGVGSVETDPALLRRALVNLLVNALQNVPSEGHVAIEARIVDGQVVVRVRNDGPMISPDVAARVFEPFFTTRASGTGLGLAVVRRIVEDLGGRISLDTVPAGTAFSVALPLRTSKG